MSKNRIKKRLPSHDVYAIAETGTGAHDWFKIGVAWEHRDKQGYALDFKARPLEGANIALRTRNAGWQNYQQEAPRKEPENTLFERSSERTRKLTIAIRKRRKR